MTKFFSQAFSGSGHRCVYCCRDLLADFDAFMLAEEDHLVPLGRGGADEQDNIVIACAVCNRLKGSHVPDIPFDPARRNEYIAAVRRFIMEQRAVRMETFSGWVRPPAS